MAKKKTTKKDAKEAEGTHAVPGSVPAPAKKEKKVKQGKAAKATKTAARKTLQPVDLDALRKPLDEAQAALAAAEAEAHEMTEKAREQVSGAREVYRTALAPYREACRKAKVPCEFEGGRGENVSEKVSFEVEKVGKGVRVVVKGKPETEEVIPMAALKESINKAAYYYTDQHVGLREKAGNKGGSLSNRLRAVLR